MMRKRLAALVLALCIFAGVFIDVPAARAAESYTVYVVSNTLPVYKSASAASKLLGTMPYGTDMTCIAVNGSWATVRNSAGTVGYCAAASLSTADPNTLNVKASVNAANAPLYKVPSADTAVWKKLAKGSSFTAVAITPDNNWVRLRNGKYYGYMQAQYLTTAGTAPSPTAAPSSDLAGKVYISVTALPVYASASTSAKKLGTMYYGQDMTCVSVTGSWAKVKNASGATGYCQVSGIAKSNPNNLSQRVYISAASAPIYKAPSTGTKIWMTLKKNASYTAVAITPDGEWTRIQNGKYFAYIQTKYLSNAAATAAPTAAPTPAPTQSIYGTYYAAAATVTIYQSASASAKSLGVLSYGESTTIIAASGDWAQVKSSSGISGYCKLSQLSNKNPNNLSLKIYINTDKAPIYKIASENSAVWMTLKKDASYTAVAVTPDGVWTRIQNGNYFAYILSRYLSADAVTPAPTATPTPKPTAAPTATPAPTQSASGTYYAIGTTVTIYQSAATSAKSLGVLSYGESTTVTAVSGDWAQVKSSAGVSGYCKLSELSVKDPNTYSQTVYISADNAPIYKIASENSAIWMTLKKNASYTAVAVTPDGAWVRIKNGSYYAYISSKYVSANKVEEPAPEQTVYVTLSSLPVYVSDSASSKVLGTMCLGESMTMIGANDGWAKVKNSSGTVGYCLVSGLSTKDINTLNKPYYAKNKTVTLYSRSISGASAATTVAQNTSLMAVCLSADGEWARIALSSGGFAYARVSDLSETRIDDGTQISDITPVTVYVIPTSLTVYASASKSAKSLGTMYFGQTMTCTGKSSAWARVVNDAGTVGYCDVSAVTTTNPNTYSTTLYAQVGSAKVYKGASTSTGTVATLSINGVVTGLSYNEDRSWYRVQYGTSYGYVEARYFATSPTDTGQSSAITKVVTLAQKYIGVPYVYTGQSPSGFDCSGFTYYVFKNAAGITLKRTAYSQGYDDKYQKITNKADLKVGDILFFNTVTTDDDLCDHAGIYLGSNQFIHASSGGGKVMISSLGTNSTSYYYRTFSWARRIIT